MKSKRGTCDGCGKVRKLTKPVKPDIRFYSLCRECLPQVNFEPDIGRLRKYHAIEKNARARQRSKLAYPCVGGPLDGEHVLTDDFYEESGKPEYSWYRPAGLYPHLRTEYVEYNCAGGSGRKKIGGFPPTMIYVHKSLLKPLISGRER